MSCPSSSRRTASEALSTGLPAIGGPGPGPANRASAAASCHQVHPNSASRIGSYPLLTSTGSRQVVPSCRPGPFGRELTSRPCRRPNALQRPWWKVLVAAPSSCSTLPATFGPALASPQTCHRGFDPSGHSQDSSSVPAAPSLMPSSHWDSARLGCRNIRKSGRTRTSCRRSTRRRCRRCHRRCRPGLPSPLPMCAGPAPKRSSHAAVWGGCWACRGCPRRHCPFSAS
mmetsp:Transcript_71868/g.189500  ORF Transcript_71868/g.189500 Transcript_71868/m.189500 type:complete len:228 (-) Transcript_71868:856-1539(-)